MRNPQSTSVQGKIKCTRRSVMITKWHLSHPEMAQEPVGSPSGAINVLLDTKDHVRSKFRLICV